MKTTYLAISLFAILVLNAFSAISQDIMFTYDESGNRVRREVVELKSTTTSFIDSTSTDSIGKEITENSIGKFGKTTISVFPNPTPGVLQLETTGDISSPGSYYIFDFTGKEILNSSLNKSNIQVDMSSFPSGKYILKISCNNKNKEWVIVKE